MKALFPIILSVIVLSSCGPRHGATAAYDTEAMFLFDRTGLRNTTGSVNVFERFIALHDEWQSAQVCMGYISDIDQEYALRFALPAEHYLTGNATIRRARVKNFEQAVQKAFDSLQAASQSQSRPHSIVSSLTQTDATC